MKYILIVVALWVPSLVIAQKEIKTIDGQATMYVNADYAKKEIKKVLVMADIHQADEFEKIVTQFKKMGVQAMTSAQLLPPVKEYSPEDIDKICATNQIDAIVKIEIINTSTGTGMSKFTKAVNDRIEMELTMQDLRGVTIVKFIGRSFAPTKAKGMQKFVKAVSTELKEML
jgi:hypothetical protein